LIISCPESHEAYENDRCKRFGHEAHPRGAFLPKVAARLVLRVELCHLQDAGRKGEPVSTVAIAKGSQAIFVAPPNAGGTPAVISSTVTLTPAAGATPIAGTYTLTLTLKNAANPNGFTGSHTYTVTATSGVQVVVVSVTVNVPTGKFGTFAVTGTTSVTFTDGVASAIGDTCATIVETASASAKLGISKDSVKIVKRYESVNMDIRIKNNGESDADLTVEAIPVVLGVAGKSGNLLAAVEKGSMTSHGEKVVMHEQRTILSGDADTFPFAVPADGEIGSSSEYVFRITGTLDGEAIDVCVGTGYSIKG
jgi:hypothetical protein